MSTILIADDHAITREPLARLLQYEGFDTRCAANGAEALDAVREERPDLVLLDLMMPKMNGLAFLRALRAHERAAAAGARAARLPVILMTAVVDCTDVDHARELGVRDVLPKAKFSVDELIRRVRATLTPAPAPAARASGM